jgi:hypothetical protein
MASVISENYYSEVVRALQPGVVFRELRVFSYLVEGVRVFQVLPCNHCRTLFTMSRPGPRRGLLPRTAPM